MNSCLCFTSGTVLVTVVVNIKRRFQSIADICAFSAFQSALIRCIVGGVVAFLAAVCSVYLFLQAGLISKHYAEMNADVDERTKDADEGTTNDSADNFIMTTQSTANLPKNTTMWRVVFIMHGIFAYVLVIGAAAVWLCVGTRLRIFLNCWLAVIVLDTFIYRLPSIAFYAWLLTQPPVPPQLLETEVVSSTNFALDLFMMFMPLPLLIVAGVAAVRFRAEMAAKNRRTRHSARQKDCEDHGNSSYFKRVWLVRAITVDSQRRPMLSRSPSNTRASFSKRASMNSNEVLDRLKASSELLASGS